MKKACGGIAAAVCLSLLAAVTPVNGAPAADSSPARPFTAVPVSTLAQEHCPEGYVPAAESETMALYVDAKNGWFANYDKRTGSLWRSCPEGTDSDAIAGAAEKSRMKSQLYLEYYDEYNNAYTYNSYDHSVGNQLLECYQADGGVEFVYTLTNYVRSLADVPAYISAERFGRFFLNEATEEERVILNKRFVQMEDGRYKRYTIPPFELKKLFALMDRTGYDAQQLQIDREENRELLQDAGAAAKARVQFVVPVQVTLADAGVTVSIPASRIEQTAGYHLHKIRLNEYYAAAPAGEDGYLLVPDGSGALLNFDNGKAAGGEIAVPVYGTDETQPQESQRLETEQARLPLFGIKRGETGVLAILEKGRSLASVCAITSGSRSQFNRVCAEFVLEQKGTVTLDDRSAQTVFETAPYTGDYVVRYVFTEKGRADYASMAALYRTYLFGERPPQTAGEIPSYLRLLGSVDKRQQFLCFSYFGDEVLTSYAQARRIVGELAEAGVSGLQVRYSGLLGGGLRHYSPLKPVRNGCLGSEDELRELQKEMKAAGGKLFADIALVRVFQNGKGFRYSRDGSKYLSQKAMQLYDYSPVTHLAITENAYRRGIPYDFVLSASRVPTAAQKASAFLENIGMEGAFLDDLGTLLVSDQNKKAPVNREAARENALRACGAFKNTELLSNGGNAEVLPLVQGVLDIPQGGSGYHMEDSVIPFYQMVMHGYVDYAGAAINLTGDAEESFLKAIESGGSLQFCVMQADASALKNTGYGAFFSVEYAVWKERMIHMYTELNRVLSGCRGSVITAHESIGKTVCTTYSNGKRIYVNYDEQAASVTHGGETFTVPARSYYVEG